MLTFKVASFNISYNCIIRRSFLLKFMVVINTAYATMKMSGPKTVITIKVNQRYALSCENATLAHAGRFSEKTAQEQSARVAKMQGDSTLLRSSESKALITDTSRTPSAKKGAYAASPSTQHPADQPVDDKKKGTNDKGIIAAPATWIRSSGLVQISIPNRNSRSSLFSGII
jgi:hypothetical protein